VRLNIEGNILKNGIINSGMLFPIIAPYTSTAWQSIPDPTRSIPPVISTDWLSKNLKNSDLVILDIREPDAYSKGHIPGSINIPFSAWITCRNELLLELPDDDTLFSNIASAGMEKNSKVIVVNRADAPYFLADATRVADTLIYAGLANVSVLDGGYDKWINENKKTTKIPATPDKKTFKGNADKSMFVSKKYVKDRLKKSLIIDARDPDVYFGLVNESFTERAGHIPGAVNLPAPWLWQKGTYRSINIIQEMVEGIIDKKKPKEIIIYCGVGGYTAAWWFVLTQIMGYPDVRFYDGSAQEWSKDKEAPLIKYRWS